MIEGPGKTNPEDGKSERITQIRKKIAKYEAMDDEARVLELEAELRALERGQEFDTRSYLESSKKTEVSSIELPEYKYFDGDSRIIKENREDIFIYSKGVAEYALARGIRNIVFMDRAARPAWVGVDEYWEKKLKDKPKPGFYFINSDAFITREFSNWVARNPRTKEKKVKSNFKLSDREVLNQLEYKYKPLLKFKDKPVLLFDTCAHTGDTLLSVKRMFEMAGFSDVRTATASEPERYSGVKSVINFSDANLKICNPFGLERSVEEDPMSVSSVPVDKEKEKTDSIDMRRDIRNIIREHI